MSDQPTNHAAHTADGGWDGPASSCSAYSPARARAAVTPGPPLAWLEHGSVPIVSTKTERRAARERVSAYHQAQLAELLSHVGAAIDRYRAGEIDAYAVDETTTAITAPPGNCGSSASPAAGARTPRSSPRSVPA